MCGPQRAWGSDHCAVMARLDWSAWGGWGEGQGRGGKGGEGTGRPGVSCSECRGTESSKESGRGSIERGHQVVSEGQVGALGLGKGVGAGSVPWKGVGQQVRLKWACLQWMQLARVAGELGQSRESMESGGP